MKYLGRKEKQVSAAGLVRTVSGSCHSMWIRGVQLVEPVVEVKVEAVSIVMSCIVFKYLFIIMLGFKLC